jgi:hypothetical protein
MLFPSNRDHKGLILAVASSTSRSQRSVKLIEMGEIHSRVSRAAKKRAQRIEQVVRELSMSELKHRPQEPVIDLDT